MQAFSRGQQYQHSSASHRAKNNTQRHRSNHLPAFRCQCHGASHEHGRDDVSDCNPVRRKEYISTEMVFEGLISVKRCKDCLLRQPGYQPGPIRTPRLQWQSSARVLYGRSFRRDAQWSCESVANTSFWRIPLPIARRAENTLQACRLEAIPLLRQRQRE